MKLGQFFYSDIIGKPSSLNIYPGPLLFNSVILLFSEIDTYRLFFSLSAFCCLVLFYLFIYFHFLFFL